jgi:DNA polymerase-1
LCEQYVGFDTETYGVGFNDRAFALQIAGESETWYFNLHDYEDGTEVLDAALVFQLLAPVFEKHDLIWGIHNAKFDMRRIAIDGAYIHGGVHCTQMAERMIYNQYHTYGLDACLKRRGRAKNDKVKEYIKEHKLKDEHGNPQYWKVPLDIMFEYGCADAEDVRFLMMDQRKLLVGKEYYELDLHLQKALYRMEERGMKVRTEYAKKGLEYERAEQEKAAAELSALAGEPFRNGPTWLKGYFDRQGVQYSVNPETGNPVFDKRALAKITHPAAGIVRRYRRHEKYASTYYEHYAKHDVVHAFIKPWGTDTLRFSYADPNLQNVPKEEELDESIPFQVRACFEPRDGFCLVPIDYNQQEFRMLLDYAGEAELIRRINDDGADVHQATADMVGCSRKHAKTINFGLLYGMGTELLAQTLGISLEEAFDLKALYFGKLPRVKKIIKRMIERAESAKVVRTWTGRPLHFPIKDFAYAAPNHIIQGGCADVVRAAIVKIDQLLLERKTRSALLLQVHDELVFEVHENELELVDPLVNIMENIYRPFNGMRLTCGVDHSWVSWGKRDIRAGKPLPKSSN